MRACVRLDDATRGGRHGEAGWRQVGQVLQGGVAPWSMRACFASLVLTAVTDVPDACWRVGCCLPSVREPSVTAVNATACVLAGRRMRIDRAAV